MKYPSQLLSAFADWLEEYEPHERVEALADKIEDLEQPLETRLNWIYERVKAYARLQEVRRELQSVKRDRAALARAYGSLSRAYREAAGEEPPISDETVRALQRTKVDAVMGGIRLVLAELSNKTRG